MKTECEQFPVLYKYTKLEHAIGMTENGSCRAGTISEYRRSEAKEIGDPQEGVRSFNFPDGYAERLLALEQIVKNNAHLLNVRGSILDAIAEPVPIALVETSLDCYVYSLTTSFDAGVMRKFDYNACVEIRKPTRFFNALCLQMQQFASLGIMRRCIYANRWRKHNDQLEVPPELVKEMTFSHQNEVRILWWPRDRAKFVPGIDLPGEIITARSIRKYCRIFYSE